MEPTRIRGVQILDDSLTSEDLADGSVRGATENNGSQREIASGTISTPDLRNKAVDHTKILETDSFRFAKIGVNQEPGTERLEVNASGVKLGAALGTADGTIQYTGTDFEGRKAGSWVSLTSGGGGGSSTNLTLGVDSVTTTPHAAGANSLIYVDATSASITVTLPQASTVTGRIYRIKKVDSSVNTVTIDAYDSELIDGEPTTVLSVQYESYDIGSDGTSWHIG